MCARPRRRGGDGEDDALAGAVEHAEELGILVLQAQPVESEIRLSFPGVGDLLDPVLDMALAPLPAAQRNALSRALALGDEEGPAVEPRALRVALLSAFRLLAEEGPALVAIDDSQWLDHASSSGLAYAVRRFRAEPVGLLLSRRSGVESALLNELLRSPVRERFTRMCVGSLDARALGRVVQGQLGSSLPRPLLAEVHEASGGNPFYALEIVRMLRRSDIAVEAGQPLPVPESLHELVHARLLALPPESRDYLLAAAAHAHATVARTEEASGVERATGLAPAVAAGVVELASDRILFTHPLLAAGAYEVADPLRRLAVHARLAELLEDPEARAWQLAASVTEPDEDVARERAGRRSCPRSWRPAAGRAASRPRVRAHASSRRRRRPHTGCRRGLPPLRIRRLAASGGAARRGGVTPSSGDAPCTRRRPTRTRPFLRSSVRRRRPLPSGRGGGRGRS
jgi:hypothetical protein